LPIPFVPFAFFFVPSLAWFFAFYCSHFISFCFDDGLICVILPAKAAGSAILKRGTQQAAGSMIKRTRLNARKTTGKKRNKFQHHPQ